MATAYHNLSDYDFNSVPNAENMRFGIVVSEWNNNITGPLLEGAISTLKKHGAKDKNILVQTVPGSFELTFGSAQMIKSGKVDAVKYLDKFSAKDQLVSPAILGTIGNCYAEMGQLDKAAGTLLKAADKADSQALSPIYLIQAGQLFEKLGKNSEAVKAYTLVKEKYFNSYQSMDIDKYIERASIK